MLFCSEPTHGWMLNLLMCKKPRVTVLGPLGVVRATKYIMREDCLGLLGLSEGQ